VKRVALFTTFFESTSGFSLIGVATTQLQMLLNNGYDPVVLVQENFTEPPDGIWRKEILDLRPVVPFMHLTGGVAEDFEDRVQKIQKALEENLADVDVCITHDIILLDTYKEHNVAMRRYAETRPDLLWLHWIHSCPSTGSTTAYPDNCRHTPPPGYIIYPNSSDLGVVCRAYEMHGQEWRAVSNRSAHSIDPLAIWPYDELTKDLALKSGLTEGDISCVYPVRLDRGKQPEKIIRLLAGARRQGYDPRLLVIDWQSAGERFQKYIDELIVLANSLHLQGKVNFTSRLDDRCSQGIPRKVVIELMDLSNVYIHPSKVETYSLTVHEAMLRGCLCVLNHDLPVMRELWGDNAIYFDFSSDRIDREYQPTEQAFWNDEALRLIAELNQNRAVLAKTTARKEWSPQAMWKEFAPLLFKQPVGA